MTINSEENPDREPTIEELLIGEEDETVDEWWVNEYLRQEAREDLYYSGTGECYGDESYDRYVNNY